MAEDPNTVSVTQGAWKAAAWFFENSLDMFLAVRGARVKSVNASWTRHTGWAPQASIERSLWELVHADETPAVQGLFSRLVLGERADCEFRVRARSGDWLWMRAQVVRGEEDWTLAILRDITEEKLREIAGLEAREAAAMLAATAGVTVWRYDPDSDDYQINPDFTRSSPSRAPRLHRRGGEVRNTVHRSDAIQFFEAWGRTLATGEPGTMTYRERTKSGDWRHMRVAWKGARQMPSGRWEIVGIAQDVTELVASRDAARVGEQAALAAAQAKSQFLANVSHEIRTPMNGVLGLLRMIESAPSAEARGGFLEQALASGVALSDLLNDIIDYADIETGRVELAPEPIDPVAEVETVLRLLEPQAKAKGLELRAELTAGAGIVSIDPRRWRKMVHHLIGNALKFTERGSVTVRLAAVGEGDGRRLRLAVEDTGVGVPADVQAGLFERFWQADGSATRRFGGLGLGLAITRQFAELMEGATGFASREGEGSRFWFEIAARPASAGAATPLPSTWLSGLRVLVVEDNPVNRQVATHILGLLGAEVETAEDGAQGVAAIESRDFDIVFMDIQMPVMDGVEATRRIRAMAEPKRSVPIVATTANVLPEHLETYRLSGINGVVAKPISPTALLNEVARVANDPDAGGKQAPHRAA